MHGLPWQISGSIVMRSSRDGMRPRLGMAEVGPILAQGCVRPASATRVAKWSINWPFVLDFGAARSFWAPSAFRAIVRLVPVTRLPALVRRAIESGPRVALADPLGEWTYDDLALRAANVAGVLLGGRQDLGEARVALLAPPGAAYVAGQWGTWMAGGVSVPLSPGQIPRDWEHILDDSRATHLVAAPITPRPSNRWLPRGASGSPRRRRRHSPRRRQASRRSCRRSRRSVAR